MELKKADDINLVAHKLALSRLTFEDDSIDFHESALVIKATRGLISPFITYIHTIIHVR